MNSFQRVQQVGLISFIVGSLVAGCSRENCPHPNSAASHKQFEEQLKPSLWTRAGVDWPSFLGPNRDGKSTETDLKIPWSSDTQLPLWTHRIGEGYGMGSAAQGRYYHFDRVRDSARLVCLNAETGKKLWVFEYPSTYVDMWGFDGGPRSSPVIDDDRVYIFGVEGMLHCLDARNGELKWKVNTASEFGVVQNFFGVGSTPLVHGARLIVMVGGSPPQSQRVARGKLDQVEPNGSAIVAFDKHTGDIQYQTGNDLASYASPIVATIDGRQLGLAFCRQRLISFDPADGQIFWEFPWRARKQLSVNASTPIVWNDQILITECYGPGGALIRVQDEKPEVVWSDAEKHRDKSVACHWCTPIVVDGFAYLSSGEKTVEAELRCVDLSTGEVKWSHRGLSWISLLLAGDYLIALTEKGRLFCFKPDPERFEIAAELEPPQLRLVGPCWAAPILSHGLLYVRDANKVVCFNLRR